MKKVFKLCLGNLGFCFQNEENIPKWFEGKNMSKFHLSGCTFGVMVTALNIVQRFNVVDDTRRLLLPFWKEILLA